jgi:hypothetical protein
MTPPPTARPAAALAAGLLLALAGCGGPNPAGSADKGKDKDKNPGVPASITGPSGTPSVTPPAGPTLVGPHDPAQKAAEQFVAQLRGGEVAADRSRLTQGFLEVIGKPVRAESEKAQRFSALEAGSWLKTVGGKIEQAGVPTGYAAGDVAAFAASLQPAGRGRFLMRLVKEGADWKLDWFQLANTTAGEPEKPASAEELGRGFVARAFLDAITDRGALTPTDRAPLVAATLSKDLRQGWAGARPGDEEAMLDYNVARMADKVQSLRGAADGYSLPAAGADGTYKGELTEGGAKKPYSLRLARTPAGAWEVVEFTR